MVYPLCTALVWAPEVQLTWILFLGLVHTKLLLLGFQIFSCEEVALEGQMLSVIVCLCLCLTPKLNFSFHLSIVNL